MSREEGFIEEYSYDRKATLELKKKENRKFHTDLNISDSMVPDILKPCTRHKMWIFSFLIGGILLTTSCFSLYLGNVFPSEMDYLRCASGSCLPSAFVNLAMLRNKVSVMHHYQILFVSTFSITTTCLIWFGCKLAINPTAININFNLILLILMEIVMATTVIVSARSNVDQYKVHRGLSHGSSSILKHVKFPARLIKSYSIVEVVTGVCSVFGGIIALNFDALLHSPYVYASIFWILVAVLPNAVLSHVVAEYPNKCLVEVLIATCSITSPLLFTTSAYLSFSIISTIDVLKAHPQAFTFHDIVLFLLLLILIVQALLTSITVVQCVHYKSHIRMDDLSWNIQNLEKQDYRNNDVSYL